MKTLTLRLSESEAAAIERLKRTTGERTASKALVVAAVAYESIHADRAELRELRRQRDVLRDSLNGYLGLR